MYLQIFICYRTQENMNSPYNIAITQSSLSLEDLQDYNYLPLQCDNTTDVDVKCEFGNPPIEEVVVKEEVGKCVKKFKTKHEVN